MEIERKFAVLKLPDNLNQYEVEHIEQGYLCIKPTVRIRKSNFEYSLNYKWKKKGIVEGVAIQNIEYTMPLTEKNYNVLLKKIEYNLLIKDRYKIPLDDGLIAELDIFHGNLEGLVFLEVEFPSVEKSETFSIPDWFGKDVTFDQRFDNTSLSKISRYSDELNPLL